MVEVMENRVEETLVVENSVEETIAQEISVEEMIAQGSEEELNKLKTWLFKENVRIISASQELEQMQEQFQQEKEQFQHEVKSINRKISMDQDRIKADNAFFEQKMKILQSGFAQLDMDRRRLEKERTKLEAEKEIIQSPSYGVNGRGEVSAFFRGVKNPLALKKRYKDLIKIFHPDNVAGDKEIIQMINREYENLKMDYETGKWA
ncbi:MAG: hypothetical protein J1F41_00975 [Lachnospiraceae bacterium]|nr:hypothetical protein [Lachnospiraceae bacterium]